MVSGLSAFAAVVFIESFSQLSSAHHRSALAIMRRTRLRARSDDVAFCAPHRYKNFIVRPRSQGAGMEYLLFLFRHGETDWNRAGRLQGHTDTPLNATGLAQAQALAERLRPHQLDAVVSSDLARAWTTARIVAEGLCVPLISEPGLRETNIGEAEGLYWPEVKSRFGEALTERWFTDDDAAFPGGRPASRRALAGLPHCD